MRYKILFTSIIICLFGCASKRTINKNENIIIRYVNPGSTSIYSISCDRFNDAFTSEIKDIIIKKNSTDFIIMDSLLLLFNDDTSINNIDVRVKILNNNCDDSIICMDGMGQFFSVTKNKYMKNDALKNYLLNAIYSKISHKER